MGYDQNPVMPSDRGPAARSPGAPPCPPDPTVRSWIDGELDPAREAEIALHVAACDACRARVQEDRRILKMFRAGRRALAGRLPPLDAARIFERAVGAREEEAGIVLFLKKISAAAAVAILASGVLIAWKASSGPHEAEAKVSIRDVAVPSVGMHLFDKDNSIGIVLRR